uniref:AlNc14C15G1665 protein n=1 Tax=Albugo laibachii Nc14 TaxID=890382 RepID=F0W3W4_9STRA|nr:AlNc14C15G1665 [Albugo laibachii Nc14]|eukprot:CCA15759.1 AlNc14C15G1665 [Albugo laibachii Nc14]
MNLSVRSLKGTKIKFVDRKNKVPIVACEVVESEIQSQGYLITASGFYCQEKKEADNIWALQKIKSDVFANEIAPVTMVTDRKLAIMNAIRRVFPESKNSSLYEAF